jgi:hypothetical protein
VPPSSDIWVAIEISRDMRHGGALSVVGVNLVEHQVGIAMQLAPAERIMILTPQADEALLEIMGRHGLREIPPFEFIALMRERAAEGAPVVHLRQIAPLRDAADVRRALALLEKHSAVMSASRPPAGHVRHKPLPGEAAPDYRCLAFEVRRPDQFAASVGEEELLFIEWESFAELIRPEDVTDVAARLASWR